ncbi:hypothetical protein BC629DRAFT_1596377 [Irpex lacteus]|nr:hypothetical protein BC629DRAFT_1596377 [Irpex lacteus]
MAVWNLLHPRHNLIRLILLTSWLLITSGNAQAPTNWDTFPFNPPSLPLAVKNPYLNAWAPLAGNSLAINQAWPRSYLPLIKILEWYASIRVDGTAYTLFGAPNLNISQATQKSFTFTPTQTVYIIDCGGKVNVTMTFVTPIEATDLVRLSSPFSYLQIAATSSDGQPHDVQVYSDTSGAWISGDIAQVSGWAIDDSDEFVSLQRQLKSPASFSESFERPQDGTVYYAAHKTDSLSWQIGPSGDTRMSFANGTKLSSSLQRGEDVVGAPSNNNTILGLAIDLGTVQPQRDSAAVFSIGIVRDPVVQYTNGQGKTENRSAYYWSNFPNINNVIADVINHFPDALTAANALDTAISQVAQPYGSGYASILSLATRQAMAAIEYTLPKNSSSNALDTSDIKAFMKDMGCLGTPNSNCGTQFQASSISPVDVMYAAMPVYLYLNPDILGYLLRPLLEFQDSPQYPNQFAAQNLGKAFPNATGNTEVHNQGIEQTANMLIMSLAHAQTSGDGSLLAQHYELLSRWGNYLSNTTIRPEQQSTSFSDYIDNKLDGVTNQTNLALKGIIGIGAMAKIAEAMNRDGDAQHFNNTASSYVSQWQSLGLNSSQPKIGFGDSHPGFLYNLFADKLLGLNLINESVYDDFTALLNVELTGLRFGVPLEATSLISRADWMLFAAAIVTGSPVRTTMINQVVDYNSQSLFEANQPFPVVYNLSTGAQIPVGQGSAAVGAMYAPLALTVRKKAIYPNTTVGGTPGGNAPSTPADLGGPKHLTGGAIAGIVVGGMGFVTGLALFAWVLYRKHHSRQQGHVTILHTPSESSRYGTGASFTEPGVYTDGISNYSRNTGPLTHSGENTNVPSHPSSNTTIPNSYSAESGDLRSSTAPTSGTTGSASMTARRRQRGNTRRGGHLPSEKHLREEYMRMRSTVEEGYAAPPRYHQGHSHPLPDTSESPHTNGISAAVGS